MCYLFVVKPLFLLTATLTTTCVSGRHVKALTGSTGRDMHIVPGPQTLVLMKIILLDMVRIIATLVGYQSIPSKHKYLCMTDIPIKKYWKFTIRRLAFETSFQ